MSVPPKVWFKCKRKRAYNKPSQAQKVIDSLLRRGESALEIYECKYCGKLHIGHDFKGVK